MEYCQTNFVTKVPTISKKAVGDRIKEAREALGLTPTECADAIGVRYHVWWRYERPDGPVPRAKRLLDMSRLLKRSEAWLLTGEEAEDAEVVPVRVVSDPPGLTAFLESPFGQTVPPEGRQLLREVLGATDPHSWDKDVWQRLWAAVADRYS